MRAVCLAWRTIQGWEDRDTAFAEAAESVRRAFASDAHEPWAFIAQGFSAVAHRQDLEMVNAFRRAIEASPNLAYAHGLLGAAYALSGHPDLAIECIDHAMRLSPRDIFGDEYHLYYAFAHFQAGRYTEAGAAAERAIEQRPEHPVLYLMGAAAYGSAGRTEKAREMAGHLSRLVPGISAANVEETFPYCRQEDRRRLAAGLRAGGLS